MLEVRIRRSLARHRVGRALMMLVDNLEEHQAPTAAGAMAFDAFLSLVPLVAMAGYVLHQLRTSYQIVLDPIIAAAPNEARVLVESEFVRLSAGGAAVVAPVSVGAFLWVSSAGISTAMGVFETMFHSQSRPWYIRRLIAMGAVVVGFVLLLAVITLALAAAAVSGSVGARVVALIVPLITLVGLISGFFRIAIQKKKHGKRSTLPGAIVTLFLWAATSTVFSFYVTSLSRYATLYGSLAAVAIFLFWLWLLALSLLVGGEVNAQIEGVRESAPPSMRAQWHAEAQRLPPPPAPPPPTPAHHGPPQAGPAHHAGPEPAPIESEAPGREARPPTPSAAEG